jgi:hypothetical protein
MGEAKPAARNVELAAGGFGGSRSEEHQQA